MRRSRDTGTKPRAAEWVHKMTRYIPNLGSWDWLIGGIVATALLLAVLQLGQGIYTKAKAAFAQLLLDRAWAETMESNIAEPPWPWLDTRPVARIEVPRLGRSAIILAGASGQALAFAPAHLSQSAMPGTRGTSVFAAHRDTHFTFMSELREGDRINVTTSSGERFVYEIGSFRVAAWNASGIDPDTMAYRLALVTCWPLGASSPGPLRYIAEANLVRSSAVGEP